MGLREVDELLATGPKTYDLEPDTKRLIEEQKKKLLAPSTDELLQGVGTGGGGLVTPTQSYNFATGLGGDSGRSNANVLDAITQRNTNRSNDYLNTMKRELSMTQPARDAGRLRQVGQNMGSQAEVALNNNKILKQYDLDKRRVEQYKQQQKDAILASILGVVGAIGGVALAVATGGAAAPLVGAALGGAAGKAAGGMAASDFGKNIGKSLKG